MRPIFVFCEGSHDIAFLSRILLARNAERSEKALLDYPFWLAGYLIGRLKARDSSVARFRRSGPILPDSLPLLDASFELNGGERLLLLFNCSGDQRQAEIKSMMKAIIFLAENTTDAITRIPPFGFVLVHDADHHTADERVASLREAYGLTLDHIFPNFNQLRANEFLRHQDNGCGCVIFGGTDGGPGTLEGVLEPIFRRQKSERIDAVADFLERHGLPASETHSVSQRAKRSKAILTAAGQIESPSASLSVVIRETEHLIATDLLEDDRCAQYLQVLTGV